MGIAKLGGNIQLNTIIGIFELFAYLAISYLVNTKIFGRKYSLLACNILASVGFTLQIIFEALDFPEFIFLILVGVCKFGIGGSIYVCMLYSSGLFATEIRSSVMSVLHIIGAMGSVISAMIVQVVIRTHKDRLVKILFC